MGMTIKKAKAIVKGITDKIDCNTVDIDDWAKFWGFTREEYEEFLDMSIKTIDTMRKYQQLEDFARWVAVEVIDEDMWELNHLSFAELACRKLVQLGVMREGDGEYTYEVVEDGDEP